MPNSSVDSGAIVAKVKKGDPMGNEDLRRWLSRGIRFYLSRRMGVEKLDERVTETFAILTTAIKHEDVHQHEALMELVRTVVLKQLGGYIDEDLRGRSQPWVEGPPVVLSDRRAIHPKTVGRMALMLTSMSARDREALTRFYSREQQEEKICQEMQLSERDFGLMKASAKASFDESIRLRCN